MEIYVNTFTQARDAFSAVKEWVPVIVSIIALLTTAYIARVTTSLQKDANYRDIQRMFRDFYAIGSNEPEKQKIIADIVNPQNTPTSDKNKTPTDLERIIILDYLVILEACFLESKKNKKLHNHNMIDHEIEKIKHLPGFGDAMKQYFDSGFKKHINDKLQKGSTTPTAPSQPPAQQS